MATGKRKNDLREKQIKYEQAIAAPPKEDYLSRLINAYARRIKLPDVDVTDEALARNLMLIYAPAYKGGHNQTVPHDKIEAFNKGWGSLLKRFGINTIDGTADLNGPLLRDFLLMLRAAEERGRREARDGIENALAFLESEYVNAYLNKMPDEVEGDIAFGIGLLKDLLPQDKSLIKPAPLSVKKQAPTGIKKKKK